LSNTQRGLLGKHQKTQQIKANKNNALTAEKVSIQTRENSLTSTKVCNRSYAHL